MLNSVKCYGSTAASNSAGVGSIPTTDARPHIEIDGVRFLYTNAAAEWDAIRAVLGGCGFDEEFRRHWLNSFEHISTPEEVRLEQAAEEMSAQEFERTLGIVEKMKGLSPASVRAIVNMGHILLESKERED
jgi:hypothetical protein